MKKIQHFFLFFLIFLLTLALTSCSGSAINNPGDSVDDPASVFDKEYGSDGSYDSSSKEDYVAGGSTSVPEFDYEIPSPSEPGYGDESEGVGDDVYVPDDDITSEIPPVIQGPAAGQITSSAWSDHKNYDFWTNLFKSDQQNNKGLFSNYFTKLNDFNQSLNTQKMVTVKIIDNSLPVINATVTIKNDNYNFTAKTNAKGLAYLFLPTDPVFPYNIEYNNENYELTEYSSEIIELSTTMPQEKPINYYLDLMFVIDTTGSMGDELTYLKEEIKDVIERIDTNNQTIRLSLLFYRDEGDQYITRFFDFTTNIDEQFKNINDQRASGGGDFEEAVDIALDLAINQASWDTYSNKILIHVLDAPPHSTKQNLNLFADSVLKAAEQGIRIIPVASSGIDKWTEYLLRTEALITGGTYTYITNHSGIGGNHIDATVGEVVVEYLNDMLVRLINEYYTGVETTPIPYNQTQQKQ